MDASKESDRSSQDPSRGFFALSDPARIEIVRELQCGPACNCDLVPRLGMAPNLLSYHIRILRDAGLVEGFRHGRRTEYRLRPQRLQDLTVELLRLAVVVPELKGDERDVVTNPADGFESRRPLIPIATPEVR